MAYQRHGRYSSNDPGFALVAAGTAMAAVLDPFPTNGWIVDVLIHVGKYPPSGGTPTVEAAVYDTASSAPDDKVGDTARFTPAALMDTGAGGAIYARPITWTGGGTGSPLQTAIKARSGIRFAVAVNVQGSGQIAVGMVFAANATNENKVLYRDYSVSSTPPAIFQVDNSSYEGQLSLAIGYHPNTAPTHTYTGTTGTTNSPNPTISGAFSDAESAYGDRMTAYQIQVRRKDTGALVWNPGEFTASSTERSSGTFAVPYAGTPLVPGVTYQVIIRVADEFGAYSSWSYNGAPEFTYASGPIVALTGPTGKQTNVTTMTIAGNYYHQSLLAANAVKVRIKRNGALYYESNAITKTIAAPPNTSTPTPFTIAQADLSPALGTLPAGSEYTVEVMARDTGNVWGGYSPTRSFTSNARPNIPNGLSPANNSVVTSYPLVYFFSTDPDDVPPALTAELRIKNSSGTVLFTRTATWNSSKGRFEYQVTSTDFAAYGDFRLDARAYDGYLYSDYSPEVVVTYAAGPVPAFTSPVDGGSVVTTKPNFVWDIVSGDQAQWKIDILTAAAGYGTEEPAQGYDYPLFGTGWQTHTSLRSYQLAQSVLANEQWYQAILSVKNSVGLEGTTIINFKVEFPPLRTITGFSATVVPGHFDRSKEGSQVLLTWEPTDYPTSQFEEYRVTKRLASESPGKARTIFRSSSPLDTRLLDDNVRGDEEYVYAITQVVTRETETQRSDRVESAVSLTFRGIIINDATFSGDYRVVIRHWTEFSINNSVAGTERVPWGASKPVVVFGSENYDTIRIVAQFIDDDQGTAMDYFRAANELRDRMVPVMIRHPRGPAWFCSIKALNWDFTQSGMPVATFELVQNNYSEGVIL